MAANDPKKKKLAPGRHKQAIKRNRQSEKRNARNKPALSTMRTAIRNLRGIIEKADKKAAPALFIQTQSLIDRAIKRGLLHASTGRRQIARLHKRVQAL